MSVQDLIKRLQLMNQTAEVIHDQGYGYNGIEAVQTLEDGRVEIW